MFKQASDLIVKHERLIILAVLLAFVWLNYTKVVNYLDRRANATAAQASKQLQQQQLTDKQLADVTKTVQQQYAGLVTKLDTQIASLRSAQAKRDTQTSKQQSLDATLPPDQLAGRWTALIKQDGIQATPTGYQVSSAAAVQTVEDLDVIPGLLLDLQDEKAVVSDKDLELTASRNVNSALDDQVKGLNAEITKQNVACQADITALKAQQRKSKLRWFGVGIVVGAIARNLVGL